VQLFREKIQSLDPYLDFCPFSAIVAESLLIKLFFLGKIGVITEISV
jgi:hypothetical protein